MTGKLDLVCQHASKDRGAATAGRVANQERQRIERSKVIQSGQVLAARQVGGRETDQTSQRNCQTSRDATRGAAMSAMSLCRSELDTRGLDQKQTTLEQRFRYNFGTTEGEISGEGACKRRSAKAL